MNINRRGFLMAGGATALTACSTVKPAINTEANKSSVVSDDPFKGTQGVPLAVGYPCLQAPAERTMGISWAVSGLAKGEVEVSTSPTMSNSRVFRPGGYGLVPIDVSALNVRLVGLNPGTKYYYRTITTPFIDYKNIYKAKLGEPIVSKIYSFTTMGIKTPAHFCVMNDTHARWKGFGPVVEKVKSISPSVLIWNGDATNTTQSKRTAVEIFLDPPIAAKDYACEVPVCFESGNHDFRGSWISKKEEVMMPRDPAERSGSQWDLKWNFAFRLGDIAMIGMDTGEDKPDAHPKWFGLANFEPYRKAQASWLKEVLSRADIASAKYKLVFCHIPLFAANTHPDYPHDGVKIDPEDYAYWSRECYDLWGPIMEEAGVTAAICAHRHRFRCDRPTADRPWWQFVGGGPVLDQAKPESAPTVIEGMVENGRLRVKVHDLLMGGVRFDEIIA